MNDYNDRIAKNDHPEWALSNWINKQPQDPRWAKSLINPTTCPNTIINPCNFIASIVNGKIQIK